MLLKKLKNDKTLSSAQRKRRYKQAQRLDPLKKNNEIKLRQRWRLSKPITNKDLKRDITKKILYQNNKDV